jgi:hypothetical protein
LGPSVSAANIEAGSWRIQEEARLDSLTIQNEPRPHQRLWQAVLDNAIAEWVGGPVEHKSNAEYFLFHDEDHFPFVCRSAGLDPESTRESLWTIRSLAVSELNLTVA